MNLSISLRPLGVVGFSEGVFHTLVRWAKQSLGSRIVFTTLACVAVGALAKPATARATERWETLQAIHMVENPTDSPRFGPHGELGPYQFRRSTWKMYSKKSFHSALDREESDRVAVKHYEWIREGLIRNGIEPSAYHIALAWNAGLQASINGHIGAASRSYAERVSTIAGDLSRKQVAAGP
jgi:hypothetical protein